MSNWPAHPSIYEINTWIWLSELREATGAAVDLGSVPDAVWDRLAALGIDAVWLMGVWERSPTGIAIANRNDALVDEFRRVLPDFQPTDNVGSPYCVRGYVVDSRLGGPDGLARARHELAKRNLRLILDFVPNHVAPDHPWVREHPAYFIHGNADDVRRDKSSFVEMHGCIYAFGRDPYFPPWPDVLQLNAFDPWLRASARATVGDIAAQCDGIRCDMAMLLLNDVFERTWGARAGVRPAAEYWDEIIPPVKRTYPNLLFIAEAYWDLEWTLQQHGFDFCYDKRLYDRLEHADAASVGLHLSADLAYQSRLLRFVENHDEPRAAVAFPGPKARAAAVVSSTLPGARLFHDGQFEGRRVRVPVFLSRRPNEAADPETEDFYARVLAAATSPTLREGDWTLRAHSGWAGNDSHQHLVAWSWTSVERHYVIVANLSDRPAQGRIRIDWNHLSDHQWVLADTLCDRVYRRSGAELARDGLFVDLAAWNCHLFECQKGTLS